MRTQARKWVIQRLTAWAGKFIPLARKPAKTALSTLQKVYTFGGRREQAPALQNFNIGARTRNVHPRILNMCIYAREVRTTLSFLSENALKH
jgi:hypothetical protein